MSEVRLSAETRTEFGKGGARRTRRAGKIPAVIYGHGADPRHVSLPAREFTNAIRHGGANVLLTLDLEGDEQLAIPKAIQRHAIKGTYDHVDLLAVRRGEKVTIDVPLVDRRRRRPRRAARAGESNSVSRRGRGHAPADRDRGQHRGPARSARRSPPATSTLPAGSTLAGDAGQRAAHRPGGPDRGRRSRPRWPRPPRQPASSRTPAEAESDESGDGESSDDSAAE